MDPSVSRLLAGVTLWGGNDLMPLRHANPPVDQKF
jgi:hypothetical protein